MGKNEPAKAAAEKYAKASNLFTPTQRWLCEAVFLAGVAWARRQGRAAKKK